VVLGELEESVSACVGGEAVPRRMSRVEVPEGKSFPTGLEQRL